MRARFYMSLAYWIDEEARAEEDGLARISLRKFVDEISHCPDCKTNPVFYLSSKRVPICRKHWNIIANEPVAWTEEGKIILLAGI